MKANCVQFTPLVYICLFLQALFLFGLRIINSWFHSKSKYMCTGRERDGKYSKFTIRIEKQRAESFPPSI